MEDDKISIETSGDAFGMRSTRSSMAETFSMEPDSVSMTSTQRPYPSVSDFYSAKAKLTLESDEPLDPEKPLNLISGLSNHSGVKLGDDRIHFGESVFSATYRMPVEHLMSIDSPSVRQTRHTRKREYEAALKKVGETELNRLERVRKDKLFQRSYATSSPFQVRKAFKFFDRETTLRTPIEGFTRALEFLGFQFSELQNLALFARYDPDAVGTIDYMTFISEAMFYPAVEPDFGQANFAPRKVEDKPKEYDGSVEEAERKTLLPQIKKMFDKVVSATKGAPGQLYADDLGLLMMSLGFHLTNTDLKACLNDMGIVDSFSFELFFEWWIDSVGMKAIRKTARTPKHK
jgi:hypothetical protein